MYYITIIKPDGAREQSTQEHCPDLDQLSAGVGGGLIEIVPYFDKYAGKPCVAFCNEEGKLLGQDFNPYATGAWIDAIEPHALNDYLVGQVIVVGADTAAELEEI